MVEAEISFTESLEDLTKVFRYSHQNNQCFIYQVDSYVKNLFSRIYFGDQSVNKALQNVQKICDLER